MKTETVRKKSNSKKKVEYSLCSVTVSFQKMKYAPYNYVAHILTLNHFLIILFCHGLLSSSDCYEDQCDE